MASDSIHSIPAGVRGNALGSTRLSPTASGYAPAIAKALMAIGGVTVLAGLWLDPLRIGVNLLLNSYYLLTLGLGGVCFVAIHYVSGASWWIAIRRVPEAMAGLLPLAAIGMLAVFVLYPNLYVWRQEGLDPGSFKAFWLSWPFFMGRSLFYLLSWMALSWAIIRRSRRQDVDGKVRHTLVNRRLSALFIVVFGLTFWLASFDWIMSLEPHWYSTIFAIYHFAGLFLAALAAITILAVWLHRLGPLRTAFRQAHLHNLGKLVFAFSTFWMYIWFSQYMLIWYANIPEETAHFVTRAQGTRLPIFLLILTLMWAVPFLVLLPKRTKRNPSTMVQVCAVILLGRWLDLHLMIFPVFAGRQLWIGAWEVGMACGAAGLFIWAVSRTLRSAPAVPAADPLLAESLAAHS